MGSDLRRALKAGAPTLDVVWDNDGFLLSHNDSEYTNGLRITLQFASPDLQPTPRADGSAAYRRHVYGARLGQNIYTPSDIGLPPAAIDPNDRPYAGYLHAGVFRDTFWSDGNGGRYLRLGLDVGCTGPCSGAEPVQKGVHRLLNSTRPEGWSEQIHSEFTVQLNAEYAPGRVVLGSWADLTPYGRGQFGNVFVSAGAGATLRAGRFNTPFAGSMLSAPSREAMQASARMTEAARRHASELFAFVSAEGRWVGYNATLQGGWFSNSPRTVDPQPFVLQTEVGVAWAGRKWALAWSYLWRTTEVGPEPTPAGSHEWGRIQISYQFD